jgi:tripartite-type tricarboxylate transporter receptor subunit TctC
MLRSKTIWSVALILFVLASVIGTTSGAQKIDYPTRKVTLIVPNTPGGPTDMMARAYTEALKGIFPQPIEVVNKAGGVQVQGTMEVITAKPDGYKLVLVDTSPLFQPIRDPNVPIKGPQDVKPIITAGKAPQVFAVGADQPWKTMKEVLDYAKANPGKIRVGHTGIGTPPQVHLLHLEKVAGVQVTDVPFAGAAPAITALLGKHVEAVSLSLTPVFPHYKSGKLRVLAIYLNQRMPSLDPNIPTLKELGYDVLTDGVSYIVAGPVGMPKEIVNILYDSFKKAQQTPGFQKYLSDSTLVTDDNDSDYWTAELQKQYKFYTHFLKEVGLTK